MRRRRLAPVKVQIARFAFRRIAERDAAAAPAPAAVAEAPVAGAGAGALIEPLPEPLPEDAAAPAAPGRLPKAKRGGRLPKAKRGRGRPWRLREARIALGRSVYIICMHFYILVVYCIPCIFLRNCAGAGMTVARPFARAPCAR